jgi:rubrerythrin
MAEQIERNGARFYRTVAQRAELADSREMLLGLADMEDDHERTFASLRAKLPAQARTPMVFDPEGDTPLYLQAMAGGYVFDVRADPSAKLTGRESLADVLHTAIGAEKDSIILYESMKTMVPEDYGQASLEHIIREELGHIATLSRTLAARRSA